MLILVGVSMFQMTTSIDFARVENALPSFAILVLIPLTFSITQGILCGFVLHALLYACVGRARQVPVTLWYGTRDVVCPPSIGEALARELPNATLRIVEDTHQLLFSQWPAILQDLATRDLPARAERPV